jgi:putative toxin-antitoxin system antitoxin component (TIGR02293 family)
MALAHSAVTIKLNRKISSIVRLWRSQKDLSFHYDAVLTFDSFLTNKLAMIHLIRQGVPYSLFDTIQDYTPFSETDWANILDLSTKSLQRYKQSSRQFGPLQSEKIIEMAEVTNVGLDVFGDMSKFKLWLDTPNFALGKIKPIELLKDSYGKEMVIGELTRINYGILA